MGLYGSIAVSLQVSHESWISKRSYGQRVRRCDGPHVPREIEIAPGSASPWERGHSLLCHLSIGKIRISRSWMQGSGMTASAQKVHHEVKSSSRLVPK